MKVLPITVCALAVLASAPAADCANAAAPSALPQQLSCVAGSAACSLNCGQGIVDQVATVGLLALASGQIFMTVKRTPTPTATQYFIVSANASCTFAGNWTPV